MPEGPGALFFLVDFNASKRSVDVMGRSNGSIGERVVRSMVWE